MPDWLVEPFARDHERSHFSCGQPTLDDFIRTRVSQYERRRLGKTFVAVPRGERRVLGYHTVAASAVAFQHLPAHTSRQLPKHKIPVVLLARLAVDRPAQGRGLGEGLLLDALQRALGLSIDLGVHAVEVDALDETASAFYRKYGFIPLLDRARHLYLPIATIEGVLNARAGRPATG